MFKNLSCKISKIFGSKHQNHACQEKEMREHKTNKQIDKTIDDSFPASDPPSTY